MSKDKGYSREGLFGTIHHYDSEGHKIGESRPGTFGGYTNYDSQGHKIGSSEEKILGGGFTHYDDTGHKIGSSDERLFGGYTNRDASGHVTGSTERSIFDVKSPDEIAATGSLYGSNLYPRGTTLLANSSIGAQDEEPAEEAYVKGNFIFSEDMTLLRDAGYDEIDLELMDGNEFRGALESAGVIPNFYDLEEDE